MEGRAGVQVSVQRGRGRNRSRMRHTYRRSSQNNPPVTKISRSRPPTQVIRTPMSDFDLFEFSVG